jgi:signal transduction histidine kinase
VVRRHVAPPYRPTVPAVARRARALAVRWRTSVLDVLLTVALLVLVVGELVEDDTRQPPVVGGLVVAALLTLPWRRAAPSAVAVVVLLASLLLGATADGEFPPQLPFLADLLVLYTAAANLRGRRLWVTGAVTFALVLAAHVATGDGDPGDFLPALVWGAPWAAGRLVQRRTLEAAASASRAAQLEQGREGDLREAAVRERDRIARELHDVVAHGVSLMVVQAGAERLRLGLDPAADPRTLEVLDAVETAGRTALVELRAMLAVLRAEEEPGGHVPVPDLPELPRLVERVRAAGLPVTLDGQVPDGLPAPMSLSAYRIVQEALTNVVKHAPGQRTTVDVRQDAATLVITVRNALPAVQPQPVDGRPGRGLVGMSERAGLLGGKVDAGRRGEHWVVRVELPVAAAVPA